MFTASKTLCNRSLVSILEVERKFVPSPLLKKYASEASTTPRVSLIPTNIHVPSVTLSLLPRKRITDKYFDHKGQLELKGIWIRWRKTQDLTHDGVDDGPAETYWEAKVKQGGDYLDSQFVETKGRDAVEAFMAETGVCVSIHDLEFQLGFTADRMAWAVNGFEGETTEDGAPAMTLVLDKVSAALEGPNGEHPIYMHHQVGELELEKTVTTSFTNDLDARDSSEADHSANHRAANASHADSIRNQLTSFMAAYPAISEAGVSPVGKITAYMQQKEAVAARKSKDSAADRLTNMSEVRYERLTGKK